MNFLKDSEWIQIIKVISLINSIDEDRTFRRQILENLRILIPYDSAAFFLTDRSKADGNMSSFLSDPVGIDARMDKLEEYMETSWEVDDARNAYNFTASTVVRESDVRVGDNGLNLVYYKDYLDELYVVSCNFACSEGPLGSLNLNREKEHGDFTDRELFILRTIEPHITQRLRKHRLAGPSENPIEKDFYEQYHITSREQEIVYCLLQGMTNGDISAALCISPGTTKKHLENIFKKTGTGSRLALISLLNSFLRSVH